MPYARIKSVTLIPAEATPGQSVAGTIILENPLSAGYLAATVEVYRAGGEHLFSPTVTPDLAFVSSGSSALFSTTFSMPNYDIEVWVFSWAWLEATSIWDDPTGWYHQETAGPFLINLLVLPAPAVDTINVRYQKKMATLTMPNFSLVGYTVNGTLKVENSEFGADFSFVGYWESLLLGPVGGQGPLVFNPSTGMISQGEVLFSNVSFTMPDQGVKVWATIYRWSPSAGLYDIFELEGPLVIQRL